jgi:formate dehydrogenase iron-sulfur subunit
MVACPFSIPRYEWSSTTPRVRKCQMCAHRVREGRAPACAEACPAEATIFGDREALLVEARRRIAEEPEAYANRIYGEEEAGGTCVLVIGSQAVMAAFDPNVPLESLPEATWAVLSKIPTAVAVAGCGLLGVHWLYRRKRMLAEEAARDASEALLATSGTGERGQR